MMATKPIARPNRATDGAAAEPGRLPVLRVGMAGGLVGMLCCVGPALLALFGVVGAGTAYVWAQQLYGGYSWWFRLAGLAIMVGLVVIALRRRSACSLRGVRDHRAQIALMVPVGLTTYGVLYGVTTWLGSFA